MSTGLAAGIFWALDTVILGVALAMTPFISGEQAVILAPFASTFLHDACSSVWMLIYMTVTKQLKSVLYALKSSSGKYMIIAGILGGPVGMSGYVAAIRYIGPGYTAIISAMYPALGALLSFIFLKEKMCPVQIVGLAASILGVVVLGYQGGHTPEKFVLGFVCALICCVAWALEGVICAHGMKDPKVNNTQALQIRQLVSALFYGIVILPTIGGWDLALSAIPTGAGGFIILAAFFGTASYLCYYKALSNLGVSKAMPLNITYSAWSIVFSFIFIGTVPDIKSVICGIVVVLGSIVAAADK